MASCRRRLKSRAIILRSSSDFQTYVVRTAYGGSTWRGDGGHATQHLLTQVASQNDIAASGLLCVRPAGKHMKASTRISTKKPPSDSQSLSPSALKRQLVNWDIPMMKYWTMRKAARRDGIVAPGRCNGRGYREASKPRDGTVYVDT